MYILHSFIFVLHVFSTHVVFTVSSISLERERERERERETHTDKKRESESESEMHRHICTYSLVLLFLNTETLPASN